MSIDSAVWLAGIALETVVVAVLLQKGIARLLPVFFAFSIWNLASDFSSRMVQSHFGYNSPQYFQFFAGEYSLDALMQFAVLVELSWSVLRPYRNVLPRATIYGIAVLVLLTGVAVWPFTGIHGLPPAWITLMRLQQTTSTLRILFFLGLAAMSQLLAIGWRNRELQVATGLGFYSLIGLGASLLHTHPTSSSMFHTIDMIVAATYVGILVYWTASFVQKEAPRQEFSPRMQNLLLTVAGTARSSRLAMEDIRNRKP